MIFYFRQYGNGPSWMFIWFEGNWKIKNIFLFVNKVQCLLRRKTGNGTMNWLIRIILIYIFRSYTGNFTLKFTTKGRCFNVFCQFFHFWMMMSFGTILRCLYFSSCSLRPCLLRRCWFKQTLSINVIHRIRLFIEFVIT